MRSAGQLRRKSARLRLLLKYARRCYVDRFKPIIRVSRNGAWVREGQRSREFHASWEMALVFGGANLGGGEIHSIILLRAPRPHYRLHGVAGPPPTRAHPMRGANPTSLSVLPHVLLPTSRRIWRDTHPKKTGGGPRAKKTDKKNRTPPSRRGGGKSASATPVLTVLLVRA